MNGKSQHGNAKCFSPCVHRPPQNVIRAFIRIGRRLFVRRLIDVKSLAFARHARQSTVAYIVGEGEQVGVGVRWQPSIMRPSESHGCRLSEVTIARASFGGSEGVMNFNPTSNKALFSHSKWMTTMAQNHGERSVQETVSTIPTDCGLIHLIRLECVLRHCFTSWQGKASNSTSQRYN